MFLFVLDIVAFTSNTPLGRVGRSESQEEFRSQSSSTNSFSPFIYFLWAKYSSERSSYTICPQSGSKRWTLLLSLLRIKTWKFKGAESWLSSHDAKGGSLCEELPPHPYVKNCQTQFSRAVDPAERFVLSGKTLL